MDKFAGYTFKSLQSPNIRIFKNFQSNLPITNAMRLD